MTAITRSLWTKNNSLRLSNIGIAAIAIIVSMFVLVDPAFAFGAFAEQVNDRTTEAYNAAQSILYVAAILALIIGVAPMLWGQVKVKWIVSCLVAAIIFAFIPTLIQTIGNQSAVA